MKKLILAAGLSAAALIFAPVALAHDRDDDRGDRSGHVEKAERADRDHGRNRGSEAHGRGGDRDRVEEARREGEDVGVDGVKRRGDGSVDDNGVDDENETETEHLNKVEDNSTGVKRRGDGSIDDNSTHKPKGV
ncbi:MAG: hypothetical protein KJS97_09705 [Alphaproteobacteria bacterium]|nr:hypothetical protein [Alphaproteobacteria bacterium]